VKFLITGAAGFIGSQLIKRLANMSHELYGIDNLNNYYSVTLKKSRLENLGIKTTKIESGELIPSNTLNNFYFKLLDIEDGLKLNQLFKIYKFDFVINLAAQAGVRYSIDYPEAYIKSNIIGFYNILEACRNHAVSNLLFASSSSVYGNNQKIPFSEHDIVDYPISLYAATKKTNELLAYTYSHLYGIKVIGLRFFTVYGPWGRPDMAYYKFTESIIDGKPIQVYNHGDLERDFTYIDDIVEAIMGIIERGMKKIEKYDIFNIGNNRPIKLLNFINTLENSLGRKAIIEFKPMQPGDVYKTYADISKLNLLIDYSPSTPISSGLDKFVKWYLNYKRGKFKLE